MNFLRILVSALMAVPSAAIVHAAVSLLQPLHADSVHNYREHQEDAHSLRQGSSTYQQTRHGWVVDAAFATVAIVSLVVVCYLVGEIIVGRNWWRSAFGDREDADGRNAQTVAKRACSQFDSKDQSRAGPPDRSIPAQLPRQHTRQPSPSPLSKAPAVSRAPTAAAALIVQTAEGAMLEFHGSLAPSYENTTVSLRSIKAANEVIRARADELSGPPQVFVETASGVPLVVLDTKRALPECGPADRTVLIHRIVGSSISPACAFVKSAGSSAFSVHNTDRSESLLLRAQIHAATGCIDWVRDSSDCIVVRNTSENCSKNTIWVAKGADIALIAAILLAIQKLA